MGRARHRFGYTFRRRPAADLIQAAGVMSTLRAATFLTGRKSVFSNGERHYAVGAAGGRYPQPYGASWERGLGITARQNKAKQAAAETDSLTVGGVTGLWLTLESSRRLRRNSIWEDFSVNHIHWSMM
jgi:hypothetical protein